MDLLALDLSLMKREALAELVSHIMMIRFSLTQSLLTLQVTNRSKHDNI